MRSHSHLSTVFRIWTVQQTWFWFVVNPDCGSATIGVAASEMQAGRDARLYIEEWKHSVQPAQDFGASLAKARPSPGALDPISIAWQPGKSRSRISSAI
jgi:hypothetical protein